MTSLLNTGVLPPLWNRYTNMYACVYVNVCVRVCVALQGVSRFEAALYEVQTGQPGLVNLLPRVRMNSTREPPLSQNKLLTELERTCR